ncbi:MAG TPA: S-adenosylmethionine:tRNA ribosyltransferase-isomerase, partial [Thermoanaerobaculia bacterium]|nr:S-adenosylmethionine:tRNA ribosyltransferase-isomerase [Thermoanaerobaculia bacterium]
MLRSDFTFHLPEELIAQEPRERGRSRMLVVTPTGGAPILEHDTFANFPSRLGARDVLVLNDTRVIPARLFARPKGQMKNPIEFLLTRQRDAQTWETWCRPAKRVKRGDVVTFSDALQAEIVEKDEGTAVVRFLGDVEEIERIGVPPLPPYIQRQ